MENLYLDCFIRGNIGKSGARSSRKDGFVPAVVYGQGVDSVAIKLDRSALIKFMHAHHGAENMVINLRIFNSSDDKTLQSERPVLIKDIQYHPVKDNILHLDFNQISLTKKIIVKIPVVSKGESIGVKQESGVLTHNLWELEIECLPTAIPEKIEADITALKIGDDIYVRDLAVPSDIRVLTDKDVIVFSVMSPMKEPLLGEAVEGEAASSEPEVIKEKKEKEDAAKGEEKKEDKKEEKK